MNAAAPVPKPIKLYRFYCAGMLVFYLAMVVLGVWALASGQEKQQLLMGMAITGVGLICAGLFLSSFWIPRAKWAWNLHLVLIALGVCGVVTAPPAIVVGIAWFHQDTLDFFGIERATPPTEDADAPE